MGKSWFSSEIWKVLYVNFPLNKWHVFWDLFWASNRLNGTMDACVWSVIQLETCWFHQQLGRTYHGRFLVFVYRATADTLWGKTALWWELRVILPYYINQMYTAMYRCAFTFLNSHATRKNPYPLVILLLWQKLPRLSPIFQKRSQKWELITFEKWLWRPKHPICVLMKSPKCSTFCWPNPHVLTLAG